MLVQLSIRDIVLIDRLDLTFAEGLSVLTGETGAGKSILLDATSLALGARGDASLVRHGQEQGQVTAVFDVPLDHPARRIAAEADIDTEGDLILRRIQLADGRTRAFVNDQAASVQVLRAIGAALVEIHGQHADRALMEPDAHRALVDAYGGLGAEVAAVRTAWRSWREATRAVDEARERLAKARADGDFLRHAVEELAKLKPEAGEETELAARRQSMMASEKIASDLAEALDVLTGPASSVPSLAAAWRRLERRAAQAPALVEPIVKAFGEALDRIEDARAAVEAAQRASEFDPRELERIEERLFSLRAASRKYAVPVDGLADLAARYVADVAALDAGEDRLVALEKAATQAGATYGKAAAALSAKRKAAAKRLDTAVNAELGPLKLDRARFMTEIVEDGSGAEGTDRAEFWVQTNPGTRPGPMMKVASGGELSRFMLALKVVLADQGSAPTLVFDEIDTGVGGAVADAIGQRLSRLGSKVQVLSVTHAPQVAARATRHYLIAKETAGQKVATRVKPLGYDLRREELARMLAGETITDEARAAAEKLLKVG
ncbi:DNA repair protein RecN [Phreatobacter oligotrophus]|uniref:DNA repair protein RecN n=1 Tax=Phreatobacter oligotrophus TaxID=1122261 RepID=A0A2T4ZGL0_9HYPH|nr:DNA repair protein RecN [Phreatobacter oligotrophus]PTM61061.1 DNA replication and repair protein RecN [Phreatobacter oligotrophus]